MSLTHESSPKKRGLFMNQLATLHLALLLGGLILAGCQPPPTTPLTPLTPSSPPTLTTDRPDNTITYEPGSLPPRLVVESARGIGRAEIGLAGGPLPAGTQIQLNLRGLEAFQLSYGGLTIMASLSSIDGQVRQSALVANDPAGEQPLTPNSAYWLDIQINSSDPTIPLKAGYFTVGLPADFYRANPSSFSISWIDFYR